MTWWKSSLLVLLVAAGGGLAKDFSSSNGARSQQPLVSDRPSNARPNIVFILTDDQDLHMDSLSYMPRVKEHLIDQGTFFKRHYCTIALCCPSRVSLWTGRAAHNTNVTDVNPPYGGYPKFVSQGFNEAWLPIWLQDAGYNTYYTGKLFNSHSVRNYDSPFVKGFTGSDFLLDPHTYEYLNASFQRNQELPVSHEGEYSTDVLARKAYGFLENAVSERKPFFLVIAPNAPHSNVKFEENWFNGSASAHTIVTTPPIPAERHKYLFPNAVIPRTPGFNPDEPHGVSWVSNLPKQNQANVDFNDEFYRDRLRALQAVDEIVDGVIARLTEHDLLENTYVFYSTDNGYHIGQHRLQPGKECGYEEDINIPLIVRGPGIPRGSSSDLVTSHTDLAPTFLSLAGGQTRQDFDGRAIPLTTNQLDDNSDIRGEHVNIEYWGFALAEGKYGNAMYWNNTYKGLRVVGINYNLYYSVWCSGEHELYDLRTDPYEMHNLYKSNYSSIFHFPVTESETRSTTTTLQHLISRLDSLVMVLKTCKARSCTHPWESLHPDGDVDNLQDALDARYDDFYELHQQRVRFEKCEKGYILESEGPRHVKAFPLSDIGPRGGVQWSELV
ncbi:arylsulfatase [Cladophialophora psammophila CBS 110553]|uniref:Arylsulfatase n=1 Tax=Cladophialophora psammophila CBS 110553 TaxID=1182543 RepID=W9WSH1_9EURO|nr:arylsulfatase [Cladophialophora psammophila CBS 110553]EXJ70853.1 arylsulfatase [Cladophialophora psammophila CBS 110553]